jgi:hypothetical protein
MNTSKDNAIDPVPVPLNAEGEPTDMRQYRALKAARQEVAEAYTEIAKTLPNDTA